MNTKLFTSEHVSPGHPDKICDQISDSILDYHYAKNPSVETRVACEAMVKDNSVIIAGEITSQERVITYRNVVSDVIQDLGYVPEVCGQFNQANYMLTQLISGQSPDIAKCVDRQEIGAGDQGIMFGYAVDEAPDYTGWCHYIARNLVTELWNLKLHNDQLGHRALCPDYKVQVTCEYSERGVKLDTVLVSASHMRDIDPDDFKRALEHFVRNTITNLAEYQCWNLDIADYKVLINPYGPFTIFGPIADSGLTGRKIVCDQYGGYAPVGGGAFSGKDLTKVDRTAAYMARFIAKNFLHKYKLIQKSANAVLPYDCSVEVAYIIGQAEPVSVNVEVEYRDGKRKTIDQQYVYDAIFDNTEVKCSGSNLYEAFKPENIIRNLDLFNVDYSEVSKFGHMGLDTSEVWKPWEILVDNSAVSKD